MADASPAWAALTSRSSPSARPVPATDLAPSCDIAPLVDANTGEGSMLLEDPDVIDLQLRHGGQAVQGLSPVPLPVVVHHHVQDELHRAIFHGGRRARVLATLHAVDIEGDRRRLPVDAEAHEVQR